MSESSVLDLTEILNRQAEDTSSELAVNAQKADTKNETTISIENRDEKAEVELLKDAVCADHGLNAVSYRDSKNVPPKYFQVDYGFRRDKKPICVQLFNQEENASGVPFDEEARGPFIRKVFAIVFVCLLITFAFATCTFVIPGMRSFFKPKGLIFAIVGAVIVIAITYVLWSECARKPPCNYIALFIAIVGECFMFGGITAKYELGEILLALGITCLVAVLCFGLAFTPLDFTKCYIYIVIIGAALGMFSLAVFGLHLLGFKLIWVRLGLVCCFLVFTSVCLIMELQLVLGGKTVELGEDDYVLGAFMLYTSMMSLFFQVLQFIGILDAL